MADDDADESGASNATMRPHHETVKECSDTFDTPKPPWRERKANYIWHLPEDIGESYERCR